MADSGAQVLKNDWLTRKEFYEGYILQEIAPLFEWLGFMPKVKSDAPGIVGIQEQYRADNDPNKRYPMPHTPSARFARVEISDLKEVSAVLGEYGLEIGFSPRVFKYQVNIDEYDRLLRRSAYWMADYVNTRVISNLINASKGVTRQTAGMTFYDRTVKAWSASDANPVSDLIKFGYDMENLGVGYTLTDVFVDKLNFAELREWLVKLDVDIGAREQLYGLPKAESDSIYIPAAGVTVHKVRYGMSEGSMLGIDANLSPATFYYGLDSAYNPMPTVTTESGQTIDNTFGLHTHRYFNDSNHETVIQMWLENCILVKDKNAGLFVPAGAQGI